MTYFKCTCSNNKISNIILQFQTPTMCIWSFLFHKTEPSNIRLVSQQQNNFITNMEEAHTWIKLPLLLSSKEKFHQTLQTWRKHMHESSFHFYCLLRRKFNVGATSLRCTNPPLFLNITFSCLVFASKLAHTKIETAHCWWIENDLKTFITRLEGSIYSHVFARSLPFPTTDLLQQALGFQACMEETSPLLYLSGAVWVWKSPTQPENLAQQLLELLNNDT